MMMLSTQINRSFDQTTQSETLELISRSRFFHSDSHSQPDVHRLTDFSEERNRGHKQFTIGILGPSAKGFRSYYYDFVNAFNVLVAAETTDWDEKNLACI